MYNLGMENSAEHKHGFVGRPFYIFITVLMSVFGVLSFSAFWQTGQTGYAFLCVILALLHIVLYWLNLKYFQVSRWAIFYYVAQALIIISFALLPHPSETYNGLSFLSSATISIIAEGLGLWGNSRRAILTGLPFFAIMAALFVIEVQSEVLIEVLSQVLINGTFIILIMVVLNKQLEERQKAEDLAESLEVTNAKLAAYAARNESLTLQAERERMARELHDTLAQGVAGLVLQLEAIKAHHQQAQYPEAEQVVVQALSRARNTLKESRAAIEDLRNEEGDFEQTVGKLVEEFRSVGTTEHQLDVQLNDEKKIPQHIQHHARRVLHEALTNAQRHAQAKSVQVTVQQSKNTLALIIHDDGVGFDPENIPAGHFGLQGLQERAQLTNSEYKLTSAPSSGTKIEFAFPLFAGESA